MIYLQTLKLDIVKKEGDLKMKMTSLSASCLRTVSFPSRESAAAALWTWDNSNPIGSYVPAFPRSERGWDVTISRSVVSSVQQEQLC